MSLETLSEATNRLELAGYEASFAAGGGGLLCAVCDGWHDGAEVAIDEIVRFEGDSDPADEAVLFALDCGRCGAKGTYVAAYGPAMEFEDVDLIKRLVDRRQRPG